MRQLSRMHLRHSPSSKVKVDAARNADVLRVHRVYQADISAFRAASRALSRTNCPEYAPFV